MVVVPHATSGWAARVARHTGGRTHLRQTAWISVLLSVLAGVVCGLLAPGSHEVVTDIGDLPAWPQDEVRVAAEVWFTIVLAALAIVTTILWWRPFRRRPILDNDPAADNDLAAPPEPADPVEAARGPIGLVIATAGALVQTGIAMLAWHSAVALRGFAEPGEIGSDRIAAPVLSSTTVLWVAGLCAVVTYLVLTILAPTSALTSRSAEADDADGAADSSERPSTDGEDYASSPV